MIALTACQNFNQKKRFTEVDITNVNYLADVNNDKGINILLDKVKDRIKTSELIKEVKYIPLETTDNSLIKHICAVEI